MSAPSPATTRNALAHVSGRLGAALLPLLAVGLLRLFAPLGLAEPGAPAWLAPLAAGVAAAGLGVAAAAALARSLGGAGYRSLAEAAALAALAAGATVASLRAVSAPQALPDPAMAIAAGGAGALLLSAVLLSDQTVPGGGRFAGGIAVFALVEISLGVALLVGDPTTSVAVALLGFAAVAAWTRAMALSFTPDSWRAGIGAALLAGGLAAEAISRPGALDTIPGLLALAAGGLLLVRLEPRREAVGPGSGEGDDEVAPMTAFRLDVPPPRDERMLDMRPARPLEPPDERGEALRLARELRATIEELMQARRTIELQRSELEHAASVDALTGVSSRRAILERLAIEVAEARRYAHPVAAVVLNVDGLAAVNREYGLSIGDAVLRELALRMRLRIRAADAVGREGDDSFLAILPHTDEAGAAVFADALRRRLSSRPIRTEAGELMVTVSVGVAFIRPGMDLTAEQLLAAADEALASARAAGGNRIAFDRLHGLMRIEERHPPRGADDQQVG